MNGLRMLVGLGMTIAAGVVNAASCEFPGHDVIQSVVRVSDDDGVTASGVVVGQNLILTAAHVVHDGALLHIAPDGKPRRAATVLATDVDNDLVLLSANTRGIESIALGVRTLQSGENVWAAGYPRNTEMTISSGSYRNPRGDRIESSAWIDSGHSGGALFFCEGGVHRLAGIVHGYIARHTDNGYVNTGRSVSIGITRVMAFLDRESVVALAR